MERKEESNKILDGLSEEKKSNKENNAGRLTNRRVLMFKSKRIYSKNVVFHSTNMHIKPIMCLPLCWSQSLTSKIIEVNGEDLKTKEIMTEGVMAKVS